MKLKIVTLGSLLVVSLFILYCAGPVDPTLRMYGLNYGTNDSIVMTVNMPISTITPVCQGIPKTFSVDPQLLADLIFDPTTGAISGTPKTIGSREYRVTAANSQNDVYTYVTIIVNDIKPDSLRYPKGVVSYTTGTPIQENKPTYKGGTPTIYTVDPLLPDGLVINPGNGALYGTPTTPTATANYVITAKNTGGSTITAIAITVEKSAFVNHSPAFTSGIQNYTMQENETDTFKVTASDPDADQIVFTVVKIDSLKALIPENTSAIQFTTTATTGAIIFAPGTHAGNYRFVIRLSDGKDSSTTGTIIVSVGKVNVPPRWNCKTIKDTISEGQTFSLALADSCTDPEGAPLTFTLANDLPLTDTIDNKGYTYTPGFIESGDYEIKIAASDTGKLIDTLTVHLRVNNTDNDITAPKVRLMDPSRDTFTVSTSSYVVKIAAKDSSGICSALFVMGTSTFSSTHSDSIWSAQITNLQQDVYNTVSITVRDSSSAANQAQLTLKIKYSPTALDNTPPAITSVQGPSSDTICRTSNVSWVYQITDASGIDSAYWMIDNIKAGTLQPVTGQANQYRLSDTLTKYHLNHITLIAVDKSAAKNRQTFNFNVDYNTLPSSVSAVSPVNNAVDIENAGMKIIWTKAIDNDGDLVKYIIKYNTSPASLGVGYALTDTFFTPSDLGGHTKYYWQVLVVSGADTITSPSSSTWNMTTIDHAPTITLSTPSSGSQNMSIIPSFTFSGADIDGDNLSYGIEIDTDKSFGSSGKISATVTTGSYTIPSGTPLLNNSKYFWRVKTTEVITNPKFAMSQVDSFTTIALIAKPIITTEPSTPLNIVSGQRASFTVVASGSPAPTYLWYKGSNAISTATTASYVISAVAPADAGTYKVIVTNSAGSDTSTVVTLNVLTAPIITVQPQSSTVTVGNNITLSVTATGNPAPTSYQWYKGTTPITNTTLASYTINSASSGDAGDYKVTVTNSVSSVTSNIATLTVTTAQLPQITTQPTASQTVSQGSWVTLSVTASQGPLTYQWKKGGAAIVGATQSTFTFQCKDVGTAVYAVNVTNTAGTTTSSNATVITTGFTGQIAYFPFDNSGKEYVNHYDGTVSGATVVADKQGHTENAFSFDGSDSVTVPDCADLHMTTFTVSAWIKLSQLGTDLKILGKLNEYNSDSYNLGLYSSKTELWLYAAGWVGPPRGVTDVKDVTTLLVDTWYYVTGVYDGSTTKMYVNGVLDRTYNSGPRTISYSTFNLRIGSAGGGTPFKGTIDEVRIFNRALTDQEITALYTIQ